MNEAKPNAGIQKISFLGEPDSPTVSFQQIGRDAVVTLPNAPLDKLMSVLKVELDDAPEVDNTIRPLTRELRPQMGNPNVEVGDFFLSAAFSKIHGEKLHFSLGTGAGAQRENLKGWTEAADFPEWELHVESPGTYEVKVTYSSWMKSGTFAVEIAEQSFEHEVTVSRLKGKRSPLAASFHTVTLGEVHFDQAGTYKLTVKATRIDAKARQYDQGLMLLREVVLTPKNRFLTNP